MGRYNILLDTPKRPTPQQSSATPVVPPKNSQQKAPPSPQESRQPNQDATLRDTVIPRHHDTAVAALPDDTIETVRKAVKKLGKEAATYRFTQEEKKVLSDLVYSYKGQGIRTSENEITRIAINALVEDYRKHGKTSLLAQVLERLNT